MLHGCCMQMPGIQCSIQPQSCTNLLSNPITEEHEPLSMSTRKGMSILVYYNGTVVHKPTLTRSLSYARYLATARCAEVQGQLISYSSRCIQHQNYRQNVPPQNTLCTARSTQHPQSCPRPPCTALSACPAGHQWPPSIPVRKLPRSLQPSCGMSWGWPP